MTKAGAWLSCVGLSVTVVVSATGQTAQSPKAVDDGKREITISGCLLRSGYAGYQIDDAHLDAIEGKPVSDTPKSDGASTPKKWILEGGGNLGADTGKKLQVVGRSDWRPPSAGAPADEPPNQTPHLDVKSVKTIAPTCS